MKLGTNDSETYTKPRATAPSKAPIGSWGAVGTVKKISLPQHGGEGSKSTTQKSDMSLPQHGGEGGGKEGKIQGKGSDETLILGPKAIKASYNGEGRFLGVKSG